MLASDRRKGKEVARSSSDQEVSTRTLAHNTTRVLRDLESLQEPILITRHNRIVAALIPSTLADIVSRWFASQTSLVRAISTALRAPDEAPRASDLLGELSGGASSTSDAGPPPVAEIGVRKLSQSTSQVLRAVDKGQVILIRRHSKIVAVLVPCNLQDLLEGRLERDPEVADILKDTVKGSLQPADALSRQDFFAEVKQHVSSRS